MPTYIAEKQVRFGQLQGLLEANAAKGWELIFVTAENEFYTTVWKVQSEKRIEGLAAPLPGEEVAPTECRSLVQPERPFDEQTFAAYPRGAITAEMQLDLFKQAIREELSRVAIHVELRTASIRD